MLGEVLANAVVLSGSPLRLCDCMVWSSGPLCLGVEQVGTYQSPQLFVLSVPVAEGQVVLHKLIVLGGQGRQVLFQQLRNGQHLLLEDKGSVPSQLAPLVLIEGRREGQSENGVVQHFFHL